MTYTFSAPRSFSFEQLRALPADVVEQVVQTVALRDPDVANLDDAARVLREEFGIEETEEALSLYAIEPGHDLWVYFGEAGIVFEAASRAATPVYCQQRHFWSTDPDDAAAVTLARELNEHARW